MITFWIALLRAAGTVLFLVGVVGGGLRMLLFAQTFVASFESSFIFTMTIVASLALAVLCFGAASALSAQRRMDAKLNALVRAASRRRSMPSQQEARGEDLAPVAPNWEPLPEPLYMNTELERYFARQKRTHIVVRFDEDGRPYIESTKAHVATPTVREAPPPIRVTPGTEEQYRDTPRPRDSTAAPPVRVPLRPHEKGVDRELLRQARDKQIRERQAEQQKKNKR